MRKLLFILISLLSICILNSQIANAQSGLFIAPNSSPITSPVTGQSWLFNSTNYSVGVWNGSAYRLVNTPFSNYTASVNPTSSNDNTQGYVLGSLWVNQTTKGVFMATNVATSAAVWTGINAVVTTIPLNDLQQGGATNGQSLIWNNTDSVWNPGNPSISLAQLLQGSATDGQVAAWSTGSGSWIPSNSGTGTVTAFSSGNLSPIFTASVATATSTPALTFSLNNVAPGGILSNATGGSTTPSYNVLSLTAGTGLSGGGNLTSSPTISLTTPVAVANGGTGAATTTAHTYFGNPLGITSTPAFNTITAADLPSTTVNSVTNSANVLVTGAISGQALTLSNANSTVPISLGGTNAATAASAITNLIAGSPSTGQVLEYNGSNWIPATVSGTGTVTTFSAGNGAPLFSTSVLNPTTAPALSFSLTNASSHAILCNPSSGPLGPTYNVLSITAGTGLTGTGDLVTNPTISIANNTNNTLAGYDNSGVFSDVTIGTGLTLTSGVLASTVSGGTVTSFSANTLSPLFTTSVASSTSTPVLSFALSNAGGNTLLGNNTGSATAPAYNSVSSYLDSAFSSTQGSVLYRNASGWVALSPGTNGQFLQSLGASANVQWASSTGAVSSVANSDSTLTISPTTGSVVASLNLGHANTWSAAQTFSSIITNGSGIVNAVRVVTASGAVTVATTDHFVVVNKTSGAATTVNLPSTPTTGTSFVIKDGKGDAATNNITVTPAAGNIDGLSTFVINVNYGSASVVYNGSQWNVM